MSLGENMTTAKQWRAQIKALEELEAILYAVDTNIVWTIKLLKVEDQQPYRYQMDFDKFGSEFCDSAFGETFADLLGNALECLDTAWLHAHIKAASIRRAFLDHDVNVGWASAPR